MLVVKQPFNKVTKNTLISKSCPIDVEKIMEVGKTVKIHHNLSKLAMNLRKIIMGPLNFRMMTLMTVTMET